MNSANLATLRKRIASPTPIVRAKERTAPSRILGALLLAALMILSSVLIASAATRASPSDPPRAVSPSSTHSLVAASARSAYAAADAAKSRAYLSASGSRQGVPTSTQIPEGSDGVAALQAAQASLQVGDGPAAGVPQTCVSAAGPTSLSCSSQRASSGEPSPTANPAAIGNPSSGDGWQIQGVPSGRSYSTELMTWDARDGYVLLFGGSNATGTYNGDTWTYLHGVWSQLTPSVAPIGRDSSALVFDAYDNYVLLFGGYAPDSGGVLNDTWIFISGTWQLDPVASHYGPSPRWGFAMTYDAATGYVILFGGSGPLCNTNTFFACNDTWRFWASGWDRLVSKDPSPGPRDQLAMTYDAADGYPLLFGGYGPQCLAVSFMCQDTWFWNATEFGVVGNWTQVKTGGVLCGTQAEGKCALTAAPGERIQIQLGFDAADNEVILFGGYNFSAGTLGDTWSYSTGTWTQLSPAASAYARWGGGMAYDVADGYLLMWGGGYVYYTPVDGVWEFSGGTWAEVAPGVGPVGAHGATMAYDPVDDYVVFFGGTGPTGQLQQTWTYQSGTWTELPLDSLQQPSARTFGSMTWDAADGYILLFGGDHFTYLNDTWSFLHGSWTEQCAGGTIACAPPARFFTGLVYNPNDGYPELFGGYGFSGLLNDTWLWYGGGWIDETIPTHAPSVRGSFGMTYDAADGEVVLFGGSNLTTAFGDTWTMTTIFLGWNQVGSCGGPGQAACGGSTPSPRAGLIFVYDGADKFVYAAGGVNGLFGGSYQAYSYAFKAGLWYVCDGNFCINGYPGWAPYITWSAAVYDPLDGYVVVRSGNVPFGQFGGNSYSRDTWVFGQLITGTPPASSFGILDVGQSTTLSVGASGGGIGTFGYQWNGLPLGCAPPSPTATTLSCTVTQAGLTFDYNQTVYGSYFVLSTVITDSNGFPGITTYQDTLHAYPDPIVTLNESTAVAEVGQSVWLNATVSGGWGPYLFGSWSGLPAGCVVGAASSSTQEVRCPLTATDLGRWSIEASVSDSTSFTAVSSATPLTVTSALGATAVTVSRNAVDAGQALSFAVAPSGGLGPYGYAWSNIPTACQANAALLTCSVPANEIGSYATPRVVITDANGVAITESYAGTVVVSPQPTADVVAATGSGGNSVASVISGTSVTFILTSSPGSGGDTIIWIGLPSSCTPSGTDAKAVTCSPSGVGAYQVFATVNDSNGGSATSPLASFTVSPAPVVVPPAPSAPFATSFQWLELGLLALLVVLALLAIVLLGGRRGGGTRGTGRAPDASPATVAEPPPGAGGPTPGTDSEAPKWSEPPR